MGFLSLNTHYIKWGLGNIPKFEPAPLNFDPTRHDLTQEWGFLGWLY
jgi:hypothetical protein